MNGVNGAYTGFVEAYFDADPTRRTSGLADDYGSPEARASRYALHWSMYRNNTYRDIKKFAKQYKGANGLYRHTRGVYSPSKRLADFHRTHIFGGSLDHKAGDGKTTQTAIPIEDATSPLEAAIARLWWDSNWEVRKGVMTLWGTVLGDVALQVVEDDIAGVMRLEVVHPGTIAYVERDACGDVLAYQKRERRADPRAPRPTTIQGGQPAIKDVDFLEEASIENGKVVYRTYMDGRPFDWRRGPDGLPIGDRAGARSEWIADHDWIPLYLVQHIDEGLGWGCSEFEGGRAKIDEVNDLGSKLHDQVRKMVEGAWLFTGMRNPADAVVVPRTASTTRKPEPGREELKAMYEPSPDAKAWSLVGDLDIVATSAEIRQSLDSLEDDYPELRFERLRLGGTVSGEALRMAQQPAATRIQERRPAYDYALMCAQMAAVAIGGDLGYPGYEGFGLIDYSARKPNHRIGRRPVFATDPVDQLAEKAARFAALKTAADAGVPLEVAMANLGFAPEDIKEVKRLNDEAAAKAMKDQQAMLDAKVVSGQATPPGKAPVTSAGAP